MKGPKKELIRETAIKIFAQLGFYQATTDKIAHTAGVSVGTIYNYYRNKEAILEYIFEVELAKRRQFLATLKQSNLSFTEMLYRLLEMHFQEIIDNPDVGQILIRERHFPQVSELQFVYQFIQGVPHAIAKLVRQAQRAGELKEFDNEISPDLIAAALFGAVEGVVREAMFVKDKQKQDQILTAAPQELTNLFMQGLQK